MTEQTEYAHDFFISYADADRAWVEGYLLDALTQAGVRCHSEAAFALGVPRLLEFERAVQESQRTLLVLSPAYLAEGFGQFTDLLAQSYGLETATWPVIPLILQPVGLPPRLAMLIALDGTDPDQWLAVVERLCAELQRPVPGVAPKPPCPYPGMVPFSEADSDRFFGRDREVQELLEQLRLHPFLTVIGPSGSGKSSLVFAGLVPALRESGLFGPGGWLVRTLRPGEAPLDALAAALDGDPSTGLRRERSGERSGQVPANPTRAAADLLSTQPDARRLLLVVDQFEELFTLARADVEPFQEALLRLADTPNCYVVLTGRADFYPDLMGGSLWQEIQAHRAEVLPLDGDGLRQAIVRPAEDAGVFVETALVERLAADAGREPGVLPLVQETLVLLWERVERRFLPLRAYEALVLPRAAYGVPERTGLQVAMARRADAALAGLTPEQQPIARRVFLRLVQFGEGRADTRRQQPVAALRVAGEDPESFDLTLEHLTDNRLLTLSGEEEGAARRVDIAHESLIAGWPALQEWLAERREAELTRRRLEGKAAEWVRLGRGSGGLLDEVELLEARRWLESDDAVALGYSQELTRLTQASQAAIEAAEREREAVRQRELNQARILAEEQRRRAEEQTKSSKRLRRLAIGLAVVFLLAVGAAICAGGAAWYASGQQQIAATRAAEAVIAQEGAVKERNRAEEQQQIAATRAAEAEAESERANLQAQIALARQLAAQAELGYDRRADLLPRSVLLAAESLHRFPTLEGDQALGHGLTLLRRPVARMEHEQSVLVVTFSPDGQWVASASGDGTARVWEVATWIEVARIQHEERVVALAFSPDGRWVASGSEDGTAQVWEVATWREVTRLRHEGRVVDLAFGSSGRWIASASIDNTARIWEVATGREVARIEHTDAVWAVSFSPDGRWVASGSSDQTVRIWEAATGREVARMEHADAVWAVSFSPDGRWVASGSSDGSARVWRAANGQEVARMEHGELVESLAFSPDGQLVVSGSGEDWLDMGKVLVWEAATGREVARAEHEGSVRAVAFSPDGQWIASGGGDGTMRVWEASTGREMARMAHEATVFAVAFSPDGQWVASGSGDSAVEVWKTAIGREVARMEHTGEVHAVAFSPDGQWVASGSFDGTARVWEVTTGQELTRMELEWAGFAVAFSPDGQWVASGGSDLQIWEAATGREVTRIEAGVGVWAVAFSPDGQWLASGGLDEMVRIWEVASGQEIARMEHEGTVFAVAFSPDGRWVASGSEDRTARVWDVATGQEVTRLAHEKAVMAIAFSLDGQWVVSAGGDSYVAEYIDPYVNLGEVRVWEVDTGKQVAEIMHDDIVRAVAFSPDGQWVVSGNRDNTVRVWELAAQREVARMEHKGVVLAVAFSPDGQQVASGSGDGTVRVWHLWPEDLINEACARLSRNLSQDEWNRFIGSDTPYACTCPNLPPGEGTPLNVCGERSND